MIPSAIWTLIYLDGRRRAVCERIRWEVDSLLLATVVGPIYGRAWGRA